MLRRRSSAVAKNSQHMQGKAMDFYLPDVSTVRLRAIGMRIQNGGVGYYPNAYTPFVHLDVGSVRAWPRMTRAQLASIFPDGKTVHIPSDGTPSAGLRGGAGRSAGQGRHGRRLFGLCRCRGGDRRAAAPQELLGDPVRWRRRRGRGCGGDPRGVTAGPGAHRLPPAAAAAGLELLRQRFESTVFAALQPVQAPEPARPGARRDPAAAGAAGARRGGGHRSRSA